MVETVMPSLEECSQSALDPDWVVIFRNARNGHKELYWKISCRFSHHFNRDRIFEDSLHCYRKFASKRNLHFYWASLETNSLFSGRAFSYP